MENHSLDIFDCDEFTLVFDVPAYWTDAATWSDDAEIAETVQLRGIFREPYARVDLGDAGQDATAPLARFPTARVPGAREGDQITVHRELPDANGDIQTTTATYTIGTPRPTGLGVTEADLRHA